MTYSLFWDFAQRTFLVVYRRFVTTLDPIFLSCLTLEDGTSRLYRNVDTKLPIYATSHLRRAKIY